MQTFDSQDALAWAVAEAKNTPRRYAKYKRYLDGEHNLQVSIQKFREAFGGLFAPLAYNRCQVVTSAMTDRLAVERFSVKAGDATLEQAAADLWRRNKMRRREKEIYAEALACGDAYALVWPDPETGLAVIWPQEAHLCRVRYADEQPERIVLGMKHWREKPRGASRIRLNVYHPDRIERYVSTDEVQPGAAIPTDPAFYVAYRNDDAGELVENPWQTVPLFHFAHKARTGGLGVSLLKDVIPLNDALNKTLADMLISAEFAAFTQKWMAGLDVDDGTYGQDENGESANAAVAQQERNLRKFRAGADRFIVAANDKASFGAFPVAELANFIGAVEQWDMLISRETKIPVHYLTLTGGFPSGRAMRTAEVPFTKEIEDAQHAFGEDDEELVALALRQDGHEVGPDDVEAIWQSSAPLAEEDKWDLVLQMTTAGVPLPIALKRIGWDEDAIAELVAEQEKQEQAQMEREKALIVAGRMDGDEEPVA